MCSIPDDETEVNFMEIESGSSILDGQNCKKCSTNKAGIILRKKDAYCNLCFQENVTHKFRASLGKTKIVRHGDKVLIAFSGDDSSCVLLDLVKTGLKEETHKKLKFNPVAIYIDEGVIHKASLNERNEGRKKVYELIDQNNFPITLYSTTLADVFKTKPCLTKDVNENITNDELDMKLTNLLSIKSLTSKQDLIKKLRNKLLLKCAAELDCKFVFLAETSTKLAAKLLCNISLGAGSHISSDVNFCDARDKIKILRPLKDFTCEELNHFILLNKITHVPHKSLMADDNPYSSIQALTNKFVKDLQMNFPATISTVLRTGEKLENNLEENQLSEEGKCTMCQSLLDTQFVSCSSMQATEYSRLISNKQINENNAVTESDINTCQDSSECGDCSCKSKSDAISRKDLEDFLCYSCRLTFQDIHDVDRLPNDLVSAVKLKKSLISTRNEIEEFLL